MIYDVHGEKFDDWTLDQDYAWELLQCGIDTVNVLLWNNHHQKYGILQSFNLNRGVEPNPYFNTWTFAPYYWRSMDQPRTPE